MKSIEVKAGMLYHALYVSRFDAAITESGHGCSGVADVFGIASSGYTVEFEIKTSKADLMGEIRSIRAIVEEVDTATLFGHGKKGPSVAKYPKHTAYIRGHHIYESYEQLEMRPNKFYFVVPPELKDVAVDGLKGSPYGLYVYDGDATLIKRAELLHKKKASDNLKLKILRSACTEVEIARKRLVRGIKCTKCYEILPTRCHPCEEKDDAQRKRNAEYRKEYEEKWRAKGLIA